MIRHFWQLLKDTAVYGLGKGILIPLGLIALPIFTRVFTPAEYGVIEIVITMTALLGLFLIIGMDSASTRSYFDSSTHEHKREVISTGLWFLVAWNLLVVGIMLVCSGWISSLAFSSSQYTDFLQIAFIAVSLSLLVAYCQNTIRLHFSPWKFTVIALLNGALTIGFSILFVLEFKLGLLGYFGGILVGNVISLVPALYFIKEDFAFTFSSAKIKVMLSFGGPLVPASLAYYVLTMSARFFLLKFATVADVGLYSVAVKVSSIMLFFYMAFGLAWSPFVLKLYSASEETMKAVVRRTMKYLLIFFSLLAIFLTTFSQEVLRIFTTEPYFGAAIAIAPLCLGAVAYATTQVTALGISLSRKTKYMALFSGIAAMTNLGLNALMVPHWGILGASIASAISYTVLTLGYYSAARRLYPIGFDKGAILKICLACLLFVVIGSFMVFDSLVLGIFVKLAFILLFVPMLFLFRIFDPQEVVYIRQWFSGLGKVRSVSDLRDLVREQTGGK
ncbi:hypothetical protein ES703_118976 [subsurface metagenome]